MISDSIAELMRRERINRKIVVLPMFWEQQGKSRDREQWTDRPPAPETLHGVLVAEPPNISPSAITTGSRWTENVRTHIPNPGALWGLRPGMAEQDIGRDDDVCRVRRSGAGQADEGAAVT